MPEPPGYNFIFKGKVLLCTVIIFRSCCSCWQCTQCIPTARSLKINKMLFSEARGTIWQRGKHLRQIRCYLNIHFHHAKYQVHAFGCTLQIIAKYVTELIKLLPSRLWRGKKKKKRNRSTSSLMRVSHCEIILLSLCNLVRGSRFDPLLQKCQRN